MKHRKHEYIASSIRANRRNDEYHNTILSDREYEIGDVIILDGLEWFIEEVVR